MSEQEVCGPAVRPGYGQDGEGTSRVGTPYPGAGTWRVQDADGRTGKPRAPQVPRHPVHSAKLAVINAGEHNSLQHAKNEKDADGGGSEDHSRSCSRQDQLRQTTWAMTGPPHESPRCIRERNEKAIATPTIKGGGGPGRLASIRSHCECCKTPSAAAPSPQDCSPRSSPPWSRRETHRATQFSLQVPAAGSRVRFLGCGSGKVDAITIPFSRAANL